MVVDETEGDRLAYMFAEDIIRASRLRDPRQRDPRPQGKPLPPKPRSSPPAPEARRGRAAADKVKKNHEKIKLNKQLPYLVGNIVKVYLR